MISEEAAQKRLKLLVQMKEAAYNKGDYEAANRWEARRDELQNAITYRG